MTAGTLVFTWWDTGAFGMTTVYGRVIAAGPLTYTVQWESGIRNRLRHDDPRVRPITNPDQQLDAERALFPEAS